MATIERAAIIGGRTLREVPAGCLDYFRAQMLDQLDRAATPAERAEARASLGVLDRLERREHRSEQLAALGIDGATAERLTEEVRARRKERKIRKAWRRRHGLD